MNGHFKVLQYGEHWFGGDIQPVLRIRFPNPSNSNRIQGSTAYIGKKV